jgi:hypothetical protein
VNELQFRFGAEMVLVTLAFLTALGAIARRERNAILACWALGLLWAATLLV